MNLNKIIDRLIEKDLDNVMETQRLILSQGENAITVLIDKIDENNAQLNNQIFELLIKFGDPAVTYIDNLLLLEEQNKVNFLLSPILKKNFPYILSEINSPYSKEMLLSLLERVEKEGNETELENIIFFLNRFKDEKIIDKIMGFINHKNRKLRKIAYYNLFQSHPKLSLDITTDFIFDSDMEIQKLTRIVLKKYKREILSIISGKIKNEQYRANCIMLWNDLKNPFDENLKNILYTTVITYYKDELRTKIVNIIDESERLNIEPNLLKKILKTALQNGRLGDVKLMDWTILKNDVNVMEGLIKSQQIILTDKLIQSPIQEVTSWKCPECKGILSKRELTDLNDGKIIECSNCGSGLSIK